MNTKTSLWIKTAIVGMATAWALPAGAASVAVKGEASATGAASAAAGDGETNAAAEGTAGGAATAAPVLENTLESCQDGVDNDGDAHIDCNDQDCEIFAVCVTPSAKSEATVAATGPEVTRVTVFRAETPKESGRACADFIDNDSNGLTDCQESQCQRYRYCRREMYEYPEDNDRAPGMFINFGLGVALPNYRYPHAQADSAYGDNISFDPDVGGMFDLQVGMLFHRFVGAGVNFKWALTGASNHDHQVFSEQSDDDYKYIGLKTSGNVGGFVRLQWPFERIVPYVNIHAGYGWAKHRWHVYDGDNTWSDISEHESDDTWPIEGEKVVVKPGTQRHFTFAFEPGFDVQVVKRLFGVGLKAWLPVVASSESETDNVGVMLSFSFTPTWRGHRELKEKYKNIPAPAPVAAATPAEPVATPAEPVATPAEPVEIPAEPFETPAEPAPAP